ncbi:MAG TPA: hypothetical protein ENK43_07615 [Planctomycetes bacterium]|nr:hypothetical protein [Planctomycetota bacterium]
MPTNREKEHQDALAELPPELRFAFAPLVKRAMGVALGMTFGLTVALLTTYHLLFDPDHVEHLRLLGQYFWNYDPESWSGPLIGFLWGAWSGFVAGWILAAVRNAVVGTWIILIRAKANLEANRDFLDHI